MVCTAFLNGVRFISLSSRANMMDSGKDTNSPSILIAKVFRSSCQKLGPVKKSIKCFSPTHSLPKRPRWGLKFSKAISRPPMGM